MSSPLNAAALELLSAAEAARRLGTTRMGIRSLIRRGRLQARKIDGRWFTTESDLDRYERQFARRYQISNGGR